MSQTMEIGVPPMSRKFTIKVAGCWWDKLDGGNRFVLRDDESFFGSVQYGRKRWLACPRRKLMKEFSRVDRAKAYVIRQLAGEKEK